METLLHEKDPMEVTNMDIEEILKYSKEDLAKAVSIFANEAYNWECKFLIYMLVYIFCLMCLN